MSAPSEKKPSSGLGLKLLLAMAVVVILALALTVVLLVRGGSPVGGETTPPAPPTDESSTPADDMEVTIGEGGSEVGPDGETPIGYEPTCTGAATAATNYSIALDPSRVAAGGVDEEGFYALIDHATTGAYQEETRSMADEYLALDGAADAGLTEHRPDWGGFYVAACEPEESAEVWIVAAIGDERGDYLYVDSGYSVVWEDGDWRLEGITDSSAPIALPEGLVQEEDPDVVEGLALHSEWEVYQ